MSLKRQRQIKRKRKVNKMDASKVTLSDKMKIAIQNPTLSRRKKAELKRELVKEYIRSKPSLTPISPSELMMAARYNPKNKNEYSTGWSFVNNMVTRRHLTKEPIPKSDKSIWTIPGDSRTTVSKPKIENLPPQPSTRGEYMDVGFISHKLIPKNEIVSSVEKYAKTFVWETGSFDLREFIRWLK